MIKSIFGWRNSPNTKSSSLTKNLIWIYKEGPIYSLRVMGRNRRQVRLTKVWKYILLLHPFRRASSFLNLGWGTTWPTQESIPIHTPSPLPQISLPVACQVSFVRLLSTICLNVLTIFLVDLPLRKAKERSWRVSYSLPLLKWKSPRIAIAGILSFVHLKECIAGSTPYYSMLTASKSKPPLISSHVLSWLPNVDILLRLDQRQSSLWFFSFSSLSFHPLSSHCVPSSSSFITSHYWFINGLPFKRALSFVRFLSQLKEVERTEDTESMRWLSIVEGAASCPLLLANPLFFLYPLTPASTEHNTATGVDYWTHIARVHKQIGVYISLTLHWYPRSASSSRVLPSSSHSIEHNNI